MATRKVWEKGFRQSVRHLKAGDVVVLHDGIKRWHGATKNIWFQHIATTTDKAEWLKPEEDAVYNLL